LPSTLPYVATLASQTYPLTLLMRRASVLCDCTPKTLSRPSCAPHALRVLRHDDIVAVLRRMRRREGVLSTKEPSLPALPTQGPSSARPPAEAGCDLLFFLEGTQCISNVSNIQPRVSTFRAANTQRMEAPLPARTGHPNTGDT
jgi:hypothetical protein